MVFIDINEWIESVRHDPFRYRERQATEVLLVAIGAVEPFGSKLFLKGGTLMGVVYHSPRQTVDIDFTADFDPTDALLGEFKETLNVEMRRAAVRLGYPEMVMRVQKIEKKPRPQGFKKKRFPAIEMKVAYAKRGTPEHQRLNNKQAPHVLKLEFSFKEPVEAIELVRMGDEGGSFSAYAIAELIAEKFRALLQQLKRGRNRCQDVYDIAYLVRKKHFQPEELKLIRDRLILKGRARDIDPRKESIRDPEVKRRAKAEWNSLHLELGNLPDFEQEFMVASDFYESLPWEEPNP